MLNGLIGIRIHNDNMSLRIEKLSEHLASEVSGIDLASPIPEGAFAALKHAFYRHSVLVFHDQDIDEDQQISFSKRFGPLEPTMVNDPSGGGGWINHLSNIDEEGNIIPPADPRMLYKQGQLALAFRQFLQGGAIPGRSALRSGSSPRGGWERSTPP